MGEKASGGRAWPDYSDGPWYVEFDYDIDYVTGRAEACGVRLSYISDGEAPPITTDFMRSIPWSSLIDEVLSKAAATAARKPDWDTRPDPFRDVFPHSKMGRPREYGIEHFHEVAHVYLTAWRERRRPTKAVRDHFTAKLGYEVTKTQAAKWVATCREPLKLIPPTTKGKAVGDGTRTAQPKPKKWIKKPPPKRKGSR